VLKVPDLDAGNGIDPYKRIAVLSCMKIRAFQQYRIPETVPEAEVNTDRRIDVRQHFFVLRGDTDLTHGFLSVMGNKKPAVTAGSLKNVCRICMACHTAIRVTDPCHHQAIF